MDSPGQRSRIRPTGSGILQHYFDTEGELFCAGAADASEPTASPSNSRCSSVYSGAPPETETVATPWDGDDCSVLLRRAFRGLCQVGLHVGSLQYDLGQAQQRLQEAEAAVDEMTRSLLRERLHDDDNIDSSGCAIGEITALLIDTRLEHLSDRKNGSMPSDSTASGGVQRAVRKASRKKVAVEELGARLEVARCALLQPTLENWRAAVVAYRTSSSTTGRLGEHVLVSTDNTVPSQNDDLDKVREEAMRLLCRLDQQRLHQLLGRISSIHGLGERSGDSSGLQTFI